MQLHNIVIAILLAALSILFIFRFIKKKKVYDLTVFIILILGIIVRLPIGSKIPNEVLLVVTLALAVVTIIFYLKDKNQQLKKYK